MHVCCTNFFFFFFNYYTYLTYVPHPHKHVHQIILNKNIRKNKDKEERNEDKPTWMISPTFLSVHTIKYLKLAISEWFECNHLITIFWFEMWGTSACPFHVHILLLVVWAKKPNNCGPYIKLSLSLLSLGLVGEYDNSLVLSQSYSFGL